MVLYFGQQDFLRQMIEKVLKQASISVHTEKSPDGMSYLIEDLSGQLVLVDSECCLESSSFFQEIVPQIKAKGLGFAALGTPGERERWEAKGLVPNLFLEKPISPKDLVENIRSLTLN